MSILQRPFVGTNEETVFVEEIVAENALQHRKQKGCDLAGVHLGAGIDNVIILHGYFRSNFVDKMKYYVNVFTFDIHVP